MSIAVFLCLLGLMGLGMVVGAICVAAMFVIPAIAIRQRPDIWRVDLKHKPEKDD